MIYELINPSDAIYFDGDFELPVMGAAVALLGEGKYGLKDDQDRLIVPMWLFGGSEEWFADLGTTLDNELTNKKLEIATFLETLRYKSERSSMNNIGARAKAIAEALRK